MSLRFDLRICVVRAFVEKMGSMRHRVIACSVGDKHLHAIAELPTDYADIIAFVGVCKQTASHAIRDELPGTVWSRNGEYKHIKGPGHLRNAYNYVRTRQERGGVVWSHRPPPRTGSMTRP